MRGWRLWVVAVGVLVAMVGGAAVRAGAAPVNYNEAVDGDLSNPLLGAPLQTFAFDIGANTVTGTTNGSGGSADFDDFAFTVPAGAQVVAAQVELADVFGNVTSAKWDVRSGSLNAKTGLLLEQVSSASPGTSAFVSTPLGAGSYNLAEVSITIADEFIPSRASYTFTFTLRPAAAVPEPSTALLLGLGSLALGCSRRLTRRR